MCLSDIGRNVPLGWEAALPPVRRWIDARTRATTLLGCRWDAPDLRVTLGSCVRRGMIHTDVASQLLWDSPKKVVELRGAGTWMRDLRAIAGSL